MQKLKVGFGNKKLEIVCKKLSFWQMGLGLMFRTRNTDNLLFEFWGKGYWHIHSVFVFFKFLVLWLDDKNNVVDYAVVRPFRGDLTSRKPFSKLIEIPLNRKNSKLVGFVVGKERFK